MTNDFGRHTAAYDPESATYDERRAYSHGYWDGLNAGTSLPGDHPLLETYRQDWTAEETARADAAEAKLSKARDLVARHYAALTEHAEPDELDVLLGIDPNDPAQRYVNFLSDVRAIAGAE